ncbi:MAG: hypothetical protein MJZ24_11240 [Paludibacteraceae bacterium]|nr:hypothetical protein [Candidatus Physcocola equi]MCQ2235300.1 hypothetical protein [Paludibacteraceae bacterium]
MKTVVDVPFFERIDFRPIEESDNAINVATGISVSPELPADFQYWEFL